jgi:signal recognition particle subunit SRP19
LKDYDHVILWLDYFNKNLSIRKGRKVKKDRAVFDPTVAELAEAARSAGFEISEEVTNDQAKYPRRPYVKSGYIMLLKGEEKKSHIIDKIAEKMLQKRSRQQKSGQK